MDKIYSDHLLRLRESLNNTFTLANLGKWIEKNTYLDSKRFSFKDHEFQQDIISDPAKTSIVVKCAQVGLSEIFARWTLAACTTQENFTAIYTFPTTGDAEKFCKTRMDPCINASPSLLQSVNINLNNSEIKQFGANSFVYFRGTVSETAALSVPADVIIHDEVDKSNLTQMSVYVSRLQHKPTKLRKLFSTPTVEKYGISREAETARRMRQMHRCSHCNHTYLPNYFEHIVIPGFDGDKREINKNTLKDIQWEDAVLLCPRCGLVPDPSPEFREWVCENSSEQFPANAWFVTPFSAPRVISAPYLVKVSTEFEKYSEFMNQSLGLTAEDKDESITVADVETALVQADLWSPGEMHYLGADMGLVCYITIGRPDSNNNLIVVHRESVPYTRFEKRRAELCKKYRVSISLHDSQPYVDLVTRITERDKNAYAGVFTTGTPGVMFSVKEQDKEAKEGKLNMRRINITHTAAFDHLMGRFKRGEVKVQKQAEVDEIWKTHMRSLKRISKLDRLQELTYQWVKTDKKDHFHFSLLYLNLAVEMRGLTSGRMNLSSVPLLKSFRVQQPDKRR